MALFHGWHPRQVQFYLKCQLPHLQCYPSPTSTSSSPCSFNSKYPVFISQHMACGPSAHSVVNQGWSSHLLSRTTWWSFHPHIASLRYIIFLVYDYWSFQCGHWPTATPTLSCSSLPFLYDSVLEIRYMTTDGRTLASLRPSFLFREVQCNCTETLKTTYHIATWIHNTWLK